MRRRLAAVASALVGVLALTACEVPQDHPSRQLQATAQAKAQAVATPLRTVTVEPSPEPTAAEGGGSASPTGKTARPAPGGTAGSSVVPYVEACAVAAGTGFNDQGSAESVESALRGLQDAGSLGVRLASAEAGQSAAQSLEGFARECGLTIAAGEGAAEPLKQVAESNPSRKFALLGGVVSAPNVRPLTFEENQGAYLAGYVAASVSRTGKVGVFGSEKTPAAASYLDAFLDGVTKHNEEVVAANQSAAEEAAAQGLEEPEPRKAVTVLGWAKTSQEGSFLGEAPTVGKARKTTESLLNQNADVIVPLAGSFSVEAAEAVVALGKRDDGSPKAALLWHAVDGADALPQHADYFLTSVVLDAAPGIEDTLADLRAGEFTNKPFVGSLSNDAVRLAPFRSFDDRVTPAVRESLAKIREAFASGELKLVPGAKK